MQGIFLKVYVPQTAKHGSKLLYEWLLEEAHRIGIPGGSVFRAIGGYGRHGQLHEEHFFELAGDLPVTVEFFAEETKIEALLALLRAGQVSLFYIKHPAEGDLTSV